MTIFFSFFLGGGNMISIQQFIKSKHYVPLSQTAIHLGGVGGEGVCLFSVVYTHF